MLTKIELNKDIVIAAFIATIKRNETFLLQIELWANRQIEHKGFIIDKLVDDVTINDNLLQEYLE